MNILRCFGLLLAHAELMGNIQGVSITNFVVTVLKSRVIVSLKTYA